MLPSGGRMRYDSHGASVGKFSGNESLALLPPRQESKSIIQRQSARGSQTKEGSCAEASENAFPTQMDLTEFRRTRERAMIQRFVANRENLSLVENAAELCSFRSTSRYSTSSSGEAGRRRTTKTSGGDTGGGTLVRGR